MTVIERLDFDSLSDGDFTPESPWAIPGNAVAPTITSDAAIHGAKGARWATTSTYGYIYYGFGSAFTDKRVLSFYFNIRSFSSANHYVATAYDSAFTDQGDWRINTGRTVSIRNGNTAVATSSTVVTTSTIYRAEWMVNPATSSQELKIFEGESDSPIIDLTGTWSSTTTINWSWGPSVAAAGGAIDYDTIKIADDWTGPENPPAEKIPVLRRFRYNGTFWE